MPGGRNRGIPTPYRLELAPFRALTFPGRRNKISATDSANVLSAIEFIHSLSETITYYKSNGRILPRKSLGLEKLQECRLIDWLTFLFDNYNTAVDSDSPSRWEVISDVSCVFTYYIEDNVQLVLSTPGTVELAVRLYINTEYDYERSPNSLYYGFWSPFLTLFTKSTEDAGFVQKACVVEDVTARLLTILTLKRVEASVNPRDCSSEQYLSLLAVANDSDLIKWSNGYPETRAIAAFMSAIKALLSCLKRHEKNFDIDMAIICLRYIRFVGRVLVACSSEAVCEAIKQDIISVFVDFSPFFSGIMKAPLFASTREKETIDDVICIISKTLPRYIIYASVLSKIRKARLENIRDDHMPKTIAAKEWAQFKRLLQNSFRIMRSDMSYIAFCDNPKHHSNWKQNPSTLFQCSGCKYLWYCSEKCQRQHWNDDHRNRLGCTYWKEFPLKHFALRKRDHRYILHYAIHNIRTSWEDVKLTMQKEGKKISEITWIVNCLTYPPALHTQRRGDSKQAEEAARYIPNAVVIQCVVPLGSGYNGTITMAGQVDDSDIGNIMKTIWTTGISQTKFEPHWLTNMQLQIP